MAYFHAERAELSFVVYKKKSESSWTIILLYGIIKYGILYRLTV